MARRGGLQEVELLDEDDAPLSSTPTRRRVPLPAVVAGVLVVAVGLVATQWAITARERAAVAALAQVPGVLDPVDETLEVLRRVAPQDAGALFGYSGGVLDRSPDGAQSYTWVDGAGGPGWTTQLLGPNAALAAVTSSRVVSGSGCLGDAAASADPGTAARVVCLVSDGALVVDAEGGGSLDRVPATTREVVVLSAADGSVLARWPVDAGETLAVVPDDVVVVASGSPSATTITAYDVLTGEQRWTHVDPLPAGFTYADDDLLAVSLYRVGDLLGYAPPAGSLTLFATDGRPVRDLDDDLGGMVDAGWMIDQTGRIVLESQTGGAVRTTLLAPDGDPADDLTVDGRLVHAVLDDGSVPGLILSADGLLRAWDDRTGASRWSSDAVASAHNALVMRGRVFVATPTGVVALDGDTGATLWAPVLDRGTSVGSLSTDARHLLVTLDPASRDDEPVLVAYDPASGREEFRAAFPEGVTMVGPARRSLVGMTEETNEYVVLG